MERTEFNPKNSQDLIAILRTELTNRQAKRPNYSIRAFSRDIGIQAPIISELLRGKRRLTPKLAVSLCDSLGIRPEQKSQLIKRLSKGTSLKFEYSQLEKDTFDIVSDWYYFAILSLSETENFVGDPESIAKRLGISHREAESAVNSLVRLGLLGVEAGRLKPTGHQFSTENDVPHSAIKKNHAQGLELAHNSLINIPAELREFSSSTIALDPNGMTEIKKMLRKFEKKAVEAMQNTDKKEVYRFQIQLFPVTKIKINKDIDNSQARGDKK